MELYLQSLRGHVKCCCRCCVTPRCYLHSVLWMFWCRLMTEFKWCAGVVYHNIYNWRQSVAHCLCRWRVTLPRMNVFSGVAFNLPRTAPPELCARAQNNKEQHSTQTTSSHTYITYTYILYSPSNKEIHLTNIALQTNTPTSLLAQISCLFAITILSSSSSPSLLDI